MGHKDKGQSTREALPELSLGHIIVLIRRPTIAVLSLII